MNIQKANHVKIPLGNQIEQNGSAGPRPFGLGQTVAQTEDLRLIPYGCTNLCLAEFPVVVKNRAAPSDAAAIQAREIE